MPRAPRPDMARMIVHVCSRSVRRETLFAADEDYWAFEQILVEVISDSPLRVLAFCIMPNHWHFVLWPESTGQVSSFIGRISQIHAERWHRARQTVGTGAVYGGRFKAFPVQSDEHAPLRVMRYVERNALRAGLVARAEDWRWGSLWHRLHGNPRRLIVPGPIPLPADWTERVNRPQTPAELGAIRRSARRGTPYGSPEWTERTAAELGLLSTLRPRGRPKKGV